MSQNKKTYTQKEISLADASSLQELLTKFDVDTDIWEVTKMITNVWGNSNNPNHQIKAWLSKKIINVDNKTNFVTELVKELKHYSVQVPANPKLLQNEQNLLLINLSDLHLGRLAWAVETGYGNYDIKIATEIVNEAIDALLKRASGFPIERIVFLIGGDYFNYNTSNPYPQTVNGTPQESDVRQAKMFRIGRQLACKQIERLSKYAPVDVTMVSGNHDHELIFGLGEVLEAKYENNDNIFVNNIPKYRKYFKYGVNLIGTSHGKYEGKKNLPMNMANEAKDLWGSTLYRYFHIGHRHHEIIEDQHGVILLTTPTAAEIDHYESKMGYMSNRAVKGYIYSKTEGEIASLTYNVKSKY